MVLENICDKKNKNVSNTHTGYACKYNIGDHKKAAHSGLGYTHCSLKLMKYFAVVLSLEYKKRCR